MDYVSMCLIEIYAGIRMGLKTLKAMPVDQWGTTKFIESDMGIPISEISNWEKRDEL